MSTIGKFLTLALCLALLPGLAAGQVLNGAFENPGTTGKPWAAGGLSSGMPCIPLAEVEWGQNSPNSNGKLGARIGPNLGLTSPSPSPCDVEFIWQRFSCGGPGASGSFCNVQFDADTTALGANEQAFVRLDTPSGSTTAVIPGATPWTTYTVSAQGCGWPTTVFFGVTETTGAGIAGALLVDDVSDSCDTSAVIDPNLTAGSGPGVSASDTHDWIPRSSGAINGVAPTPLDTTAGHDGLGRVVWGPVPMDKLDPTNNGFLGVEELNGRIFVTARDPAVGSAHVFYEVDQAGNLVATLPQDPATGSSAWGWRDLASDGANLMAGYEGGIHVFDPNTGALVNQVLAANGPQTLTANPIGGAGLATLGNYRAVAFDPTGNGGNGSIITASFGSVMMEIDLQGNILRQWGPGSWSSYGHALDPTDNTKMWVNSIPNAGPLGEMDLTPTMEAPTGNTIPVILPGSAQGGLDAVLGGLGTSGSAVDLLALHQSTPDTIVGYRLHRTGSAYLGTGEAKLVTQIEPCGVPPAQPAFDASSKTFSASDGISYGFDLSSNPIGLPGLPTTILATLGLDTRSVATTPAIAGIPPVQDFSVPNDLSNPPADAPFVIADGFGLGGLLTPSPLFILPLGPNTLVDVTSSSVSVSGISLPAGSRLHLQALYADGGSPLGLTGTNRVEFVSGGTAAGAFCIEVSATGGNSFNAVASDGFWKVVHNGTCAAIQDVTIDLSTVATGMVFDTNQTGMADVTWGGNSTVPGCTGTYRNGSDVNTGLVYDSMNTYTPATPNPPCDSTANCGFIGTLPGTTDSYGALQFRFDCANQTFFCKTFEFDADTDGGPGISGDMMAGATVTITLCDSTVFTGTLAVDPTTANRSFVQF